jgi:low affinity Fe/Cu permease
MAKQNNDDKPKRGFFNRLAGKVAHWTGHPAVFCIAGCIIILWALLGPLFGFSDTWQLVVNTGTTIITFLMVFLIQSTQNRDTAAMHLKLDDLIRTSKGAHLALMDLEELDEKELDELRGKYEALAQKARKGLRNGKKDTDIRNVDV